MALLSTHRIQAISKNRYY
nr:unnamed protein product [Callosobruchus analis]